MGKWSKAPLADVAYVNMGQSPNGNTINDEKNGVPFLQGCADFGTKHPIERVWCSKPTRIAKEGDLLLSVRAPVGDANIANQEYCIGRGLAAIRFNELDSTFGAYAFARDTHYLYIRSQGSTFQAVNRNDVESFPMVFPDDLREQRCIAAVLASADEAIATSRALVKKYTAVKQGLMQDLLGKGEPVRLGTIADNFQYGLNAAAIPFDGENKYLRITDIDEETRDFSMADITSPSGKLTNAYLLSENDIVFARTGASVGKTYIYDRIDGVAYFAGFLVRCRVKSTYCAKYIFYQTLTDDYRRWVSINSQRSGQPGVNAEQYKKYLFNCPPLPEQERIAEILTSADERLTAERERLRKLEDIKRGLMDDLLTNRVSTDKLQGGV